MRCYWPESESGARAGGCQHGGAVPLSQCPRLPRTEASRNSRDREKCSGSIEEG